MVLLNEIWGWIVVRIFCIVVVVDIIVFVVLVGVNRYDKGDSSCNM